VLEAGERVTPGSPSVHDATLENMAIKSQPETHRGHRTEPPMLNSMVTHETAAALPPRITYFAPTVANDRWEAHEHAADIDYEPVGSSVQ
jgi:hypothetical protein